MNCRKFSGTHYKVFFLFLHLFFSPLSYAEEALKIDEAVQIALDSHPIILAKKRDIDATSFGLDAAKWQRFPGISAYTSGGQPGKSSVMTSMRIDQPLWTGGRITSDINSAEARFEGAKVSLVDAEQNIITRVVSAFIDTVKLEAQIRITNENIIEHQRLLELIQHRADGQISPQNEYVMARSRIATARNERLVYQNALANAKADLEQLLSRKIDRLTIPKPEMNLNKDLSTIIQSVEEFSPQLKKLEFDILAAQEDAESKKSQLYPQLSARHERFNGSNYPDSMTYLALTYQPGNGLSALSSSREAEMRKDGLKAEKESNKKEIIDRVRNDFNQYRLSQNQIEVLAELSKASLDVYESFVRQYPAGRKTWVEVLNARKEATQAQMSYTETQWSGYAALLRIKIAIGDVDSLLINSAK